MSEDIPQSEAVVVARLGWSTKGGACTCPGVDEETSIVSLIAGSGQQSTHACQGALASEALVIVIGGVDELGAQVKALEPVALVACHEELVSITQGVAAGLVAKLVISRADDAGAYLTRLMMSQHALVG